MRYFFRKTEYRLLYCGRETKKNDMESNPLLIQWDTPRQTPPFGRIGIEHFAPAIREAIVRAQNAVDRIAQREDEPTFDNTIKALEQATEPLDRAVELLMNLNECNTTPEMQDLVMELMPEITRFEDGVWMDERLFGRVERVVGNGERKTENGERGYAGSEGMREEEWQVVEKYYRRFVSGGVGLEKEKKVRFAQISEELATLTEQFGANVLADTNAFELNITDRKELEGLPEGVVAAARKEAEKRGEEGWTFTLEAPSYRPFMSYAANRGLRERMWRAYNSRGNHGGKNDNNATVRRIVNLRREMAQMLGYKHYADYKLVRMMAKETATVERFLDGLREACIGYAKSDLAEVQEFAKGCGADFELESWDFAYYSEKLKQERYGFDSEVLRPYLPLERVREGIFGLYDRLYGVRFVKNPAIEVYREDVEAYEVFDGERFMGVLYLDLFPCAGKRGGAWMTEFRCQSDLGGKRAEEERPLVQVVCNFTRPSDGKPALLSFDEMRTFMHEMGHAMNGMLSDVHYPSVSGTNVPRDFVEMASQVMENWCLESDFLNTFAFHYETGEPMPTEYIERLRRAENFEAGWLCLRQLNFGTVDMGFHTLTEAVGDDFSAEKFENETMTQLLPTVDGCCTSTAFTHIFSGGYAAGYYGYKWAEVLDADIFSRFKADGIFNRETADEFRQKILSRGGSKDPAAMFRDFMGRDPDDRALLRRCGFGTK